MIDTNVIVAALRSKRGASHRLLEMSGDPRWQMNVSAALILEYEAVLQRQREILGLTYEQIATFVDSICAVARRRPVFFRWQPALRDPSDEFILDLAVECSCDFIITYNKRDFQEAERFGSAVVTPRQFLTILGEYR